MRIIVATLMLGVVTLVQTDTAQAWGAEGHRIVAELAQRQLSPGARMAVAALLRDEPEPSLAAVSLWPDQIRDEPRWRHTVPWHYLNLPDLDCALDLERDCPDGQCIFAAIDAQALILADAGAPRPERVAALKFVVHLVADVHQPMHAGLKGDRGGNDYQVNDRGEGSNLHRVWDTQMLARRGIDWRGYADALQAEPALAPPGHSPRDWALESCRAIGEHGLYPEAGAHIIDDIYLDRLRPLAERRLREAGERLARLLERALAGE